MNLKEYLFNNRIGITAFAKEIGMSREYFHRIFRGERKPSKEFLDKICKYTKGKISTFEQLLDRRTTDEEKCAKSNIPERRRKKEK